MHWRSYIACVEKMFSNPWYDWDDEETHLNPHFAEFNIKDFHAPIVEFLDAYGVERYWSCKQCKYYYYESEWDEMTYHSYGWHECEKRPQNQNLLSFPFKNAPRKCFVPEFWATSYGIRYHGRDEDEHLKEEYNEKYKEYKRS